MLIYEQYFIVKSSLRKSTHEKLHIMLKMKNLDAIFDSLQRQFILYLII